MAEFFLEILTEDMPPEHQISGEKELKRKINELLVEKRIKFGEIETYTTKRRLVVLVKDISEKQEDSEDTIIGPPKKVAFDEDGKPTNAVHGFAKSRGKTVDELEIIDTGKGEYVALKVFEEGRATEEILKESLPKVVSTLSFPKTMVWEESKVQFSRPIRGIVALIDGKIVDFEVAGVKSSNKTRGHLVLSENSEIEVSSFSDYIQKLEENDVIVEKNKRQHLIREGIEIVEEEQGIEVVEDEELFFELVYITESPKVFYGKFDEKYLKLPEEIIKSFLRSEKKLFSSKKDGKLTNIFVGVGDFLERAKENVIKGFERVVSATLEDALFFYENDLKLNFDEIHERLSEFSFMEGMGTYLERVERIKKLSVFLAEQMGYENLKDAVERASHYSKVDQLTQLVFEFTSLQGIAGGIYLREKGEDENVWKAVYEHYLPESIDDKIPESDTGKILSLSDKIDLIVSAYRLGYEVKGTKDPYGLRRAGNGVVKILIEGQLGADIEKIIEYALSEDEDKNGIVEKIKEFLYQRFRYYEEEKYNIRYDVLNALKKAFGNPYREHLKAHAIMKAGENENFEKLIIGYKRAKNIVKGYEKYELSKELLTEKDEKVLYEMANALKGELEEYIEKYEFLKAQELLLTLKPFIDNFFDNVLVMVDDEKVKTNRIALLQEIVAMFESIADYSEIVVSGE